MFESLSHGYQKTEGIGVDPERQAEEQRKGFVRRNGWCSSIKLNRCDYFILSSNFWKRKNVIEHFK